MTGDPVNWAPITIPERCTVDLDTRHLVLGALAEAVLTRRGAAAFCTHCYANPSGLCLNHAEDLDIANAYEAAYMRVLGAGSDGAMLTLLGGLT